MDLNNKTTANKGGICSLSNLDLVRMAKEHKETPVRWRLGYTCSDNRYIQSGIDDISDEDNFAAFTESFFDEYAEDLFDDCEIDR